MYRPRVSAALAELEGQPAARYPIKSVDKPLWLLLMLWQRPAIGFAR
jgi:hypothetical protein